MRTRTRITIAQTQRLSLNLSLATAISVLKSDAEEITAWLEEQAAANPHLVVTRPQAHPASWLPRWQDALSRQGGAADAVAQTAAPGPGLIAHVSGAVAGLGLAIADRPLADALIDALEPSGWLARPPAAIARSLGVTPARLEQVLQRLQQIGPAGLFARDLAECLRLQAIEAEELDPVMTQVLDHLALVAQGDLAALAAKAGCSTEDIALRIRRLRSYDPKPGSQFLPGAAPIAEPDLVLTVTPEGASLSLNRSCLPSVMLSPQGAGDAAAPGRKEARQVIRLLESRNTTLLRVGKEILRRQHQVVNQGAGMLAPMTMAEVAAGLGLHQSTVSRVVQGTSVAAPNGTFWLRAMFSQAVRPGGPAGAALRDAMAQMIAAEDPASPLDDEALSRALTGAGAPLARRTVAKYRQELGIPTAAQRRRAAKLAKSMRKMAKTVAAGDDPGPALQ
ncbi:RNA polymerase sigma-54 factor [Xinfangfangia sp. D13-10-4-6]|uniref:RNA polymerase factor sigma-54 n=1 Tax=Pseudogemmobacter hezensis TaxID=2737662 RepID=UPI001555B9A3|nr:RNA polymerase sigma-54 factor [Pseudogemmobacter hezensis]NPD14125.1 RNA polymerase sigma-54 factor [Pseudogemmobacter hezensis]